MISSS
jgi:hypothetical protein